MTDTSNDTAEDQDWFAHALIYQIYPRSFKDADNDGLGDLQGIIEQIPYLSKLGVDGLWLSPFYPSPLADGGYDVSDYRNVDPRLGSLSDFDQLVATAHAAGLRLLIDIVPNHTSSEHPWFRQAIASAPGSAARNRYVFKRGRGSQGELPPSNWLSSFGGSAWEPCGDGWYYLHLFDKRQPDLNWDNPEVRADFELTLRFWADRGVDGFRVDVSHALAKDLREPLRDRPHPEIFQPQADDGSDPLYDRDEVHQIYKGWRRLLNSYPTHKVAVGELWTPITDRVFLYAQPEELGSSFDFSLLKASWDKDEYQSAIDRTYRGFTKVRSAPSWVLENHDVPRAATRLGLPAQVDIESWVTSNNTTPHVDAAVAARRARAAALVLLSLPGTAYLYQGEELGLPEDFDLTEAQIQDPLWTRTGHAFKGRDGCRIPLPWSAAKPDFGFNTGQETWLPQPAWFGDFAVDLEERQASSNWNLFHRAIQLRRQWQTTGPLAAVAPERAVGSDGRHQADVNELTWQPESNPGLLHYSLHSGLHCLINFSDQPVAVNPEYQILLSSTDGGRECKVLEADAAIWFTR